jgi:hypothetical protein
MEVMFQILYLKERRPQEVGSMPGPVWMRERDGCAQRWSGHGSKEKNP